jgi:hypothetical protein
MLANEDVDPSKKIMNKKDFVIFIYIISFRDIKSILGRKR